MEKPDIKDVRLTFLHEYYARLQHYETQRSVVSNLLVIIAAAILAFVTFDKALTIADLPLTLLLCVVGLFGAAFCGKIYERYARVFYRIQKFSDKLDEVLFDGRLLNALLAAAELQHAEKFPPTFPRGTAVWKINSLWMILHFFVALLGLFLTILIYFV